MFRALYLNCDDPSRTAARLIKLCHKTHLIRELTVSNIVGLSPVVLVEVLEVSNNLESRLIRTGEPYQIPVYRVMLAISRDAGLRRQFLLAIGDMPRLHHLSCGVHDLWAGNDPAAAADVAGLRRPRGLRALCVLAGDVFVTTHALWLWDALLAQKAARGAVPLCTCVVVRLGAGGRATALPGCRWPAAAVAVARGERPVLPQQPCACARPLLPPLRPLCSDCSDGVCPAGGPREAACHWRRPLRCARSSTA